MKKCKSIRRLWARVVRSARAKRRRFIFWLAQRELQEVKDLEKLSYAASLQRLANRRQEEKEKAEMILRNFYKIRAERRPGARPIYEVGVSFDATGMMYGLGESRIDMQQYIAKRLGEDVENLVGRTCFARPSDQAQFQPGQFTPPSLPDSLKDTP